MTLKDFSLHEWYNAIIIQARYCMYTTPPAIYIFKNSRIENVTYILWTFSPVNWKNASFAKPSIAIFNYKF